jgi:hypothetical protein
MERSIGDLNKKKGSDLENLSTFSKQNAPTNAIQDAKLSRVVCQHGSLGEEQTTAGNQQQQHLQRKFCQLQGMLDDARVMLFQASKARAKKGRDATLKTAVNYIDRIITLLPYFYGEDGLKWYHVDRPRGEGNITLADVSIYLSQAVGAIVRHGDSNSAVGLIDKSRELVADLLESERQMIVKGGSSKCK